MKLFHEHPERFALATALMTVLVLMGCASNPSRITESSTLQAGQGIVTLRIVTLHERTLKQLTIKNIDSGEVVSLVPQSPLGGNSVRFTGTAPAGRYRTINMHGSDVEQLGYGQRVHTLNVPLDRPANTFEVASGKLTNLGSLIFTPMDHSRFVAPREETPIAAREWLEFANPALAASLGATPELGWSQRADESDRELVSRQIQYAQSRVKPVALNAPMQPDGSLWAGGKLGVVEQTRGRDAVVQYRTGTVHEITTVTPLADGRLLVAGEEGYVAVSSADRREWRAAPSPNSKAAVALLVAQAGTPDRTVYLVQRTPRGVAVLSADPATLAWRELRRIERAPSSSSSWVSPFAQHAALATRDRLVVYSPEPEVIASLTFGAQAWEDHKPIMSAVNFAATTEGMLVVRNTMPNNWASANYGKTWTRVEGFMHETMPAFVTPSEAYLLGQPFWTTKHVPPTLYKSGDSGKTWVAVGLAPSPMHWRGRLIYDSTQRRLGFQHPGGQVVWTQDEGRQWQ